jgi:hypothetical protein
MVTLLKILAGAAIAFGVLNPRAEDCECKAKADAIAAPHAEDCECKAET